MTSRRRHSPGIPFWDDKLNIARLLLGGYSDKDFVERVYPDEDDAILAGTVTDNLRKWRVHRPTKHDGPKKFFDKLARSLGCADSTTGVMLVEANLDQFIQLLPLDKREVARNIVRIGPVEFSEPVALSGSDSGVKITTSASRQNGKTVQLYYKGTFESITTGIQAGRIDQRHYYLTPDAAEGWNRLVRADAYPTYDQCKAGLLALVDTEAWKEALIASHPTTVVMLAGGGAPTKDLVLLRSLLARPESAKETLDYFLADISLYMLINSMWWLDENIRTIPNHEQVELSLAYCDALDLRECRQRFRRNGKVIFGMTGGTIGNLSEGAFFRALDLVSDEGDLLILSADTLDGLRHENVETSLKNKYDHPDMRNFIAPVVRSVIHESGSHEPLNAALKRIKVKLRRGAGAGLSDVSDSWSVTLSLDVQGREVTLVSSTRYESLRLIEFAAEFGWELVVKTPSPLNSQYVQFLFCRKKVERAGK